MEYEDVENVRTRRDSDKSDNIYDMPNDYSSRNDEENPVELLDYTHLSNTQGINTTQAIYVPIEGMGVFPIALFD